MHRCPVHRSHRTSADPGSGNRERALLGSQRLEDALEVIHRGELDDDLPLLLPQVDLDPRLEPVREPGGEFAQGGGEAGAGARTLGAGGRRLPGPHQRDDLFDRTDREPLGDDPQGEPLLLLRVLDREQRPGVTGGQHPGRDPPLDRRSQLQQTQRVGHLGPRAADPVGQLVVGAVEVLEQLVVGGGLLQRVELGAVEVLQQRVEEKLFVLGGPHDGGDGLQARLAAGAPPALAHDQLVTAGAQLADHDRLEEADLLDGGDQFGEGVLVEDLPGLARVGGDGVERQLGEVRADRARGQRLRRGTRRCFT